MQNIKYLIPLVLLPLFIGCGAIEPQSTFSPTIKNGKFQCGENTKTVDCVSEEEIEKLKMWNKVELYQARS